MALGTPACLLPQDGDVLPVVDANTPPKKDSAPHIKNPSPASQFLQLNTMCMADFSVTVVDADEGDRIRSLWFIDHNSNFTTNPPANPAPLPGSQQIITGAGATIDAPTGLDAIYLPQNAQNGVHLLTVVVADGEFISPGTPLDAQHNDGLELSPHTIFTLPDGGGCGDAGTCSDPSQLDQYTWTISVSTNCTNK